MLISPPSGQDPQQQLTLAATASGSLLSPANVPLSTVNAPTSNLPATIGIQLPPVLPSGASTSAEGQPSTSAAPITTKRAAPRKNNKRKAVGF
jgi:hypothetical protein